MNTNIENLIYFQNKLMKLLLMSPHIIWFGNLKYEYFHHKTQVIVILHEIIGKVAIILCISTKN